MDIERALQQAVNPVVLQVHQNGNRHLPEWRFLFCCGVRPGARGVEDAAPYGCIIDGAVGRADVGSELSAASGRGSEVSEWPRSKFPASAVRQRRNFGHHNRIIGPYE